MIVGAGIDVIGNRRLERELASGGWAIADGVFTADEIRYCSHAAHPERRFARCFAAKEAALKALGVEVADTAWLREVEAHPEAGCGTGIALHGRAQARAAQLGVTRVFLAVAEGRKSSGALVLLEC